MKGEEFRERFGGFYGEGYEKVEDLLRVRASEKLRSDFRILESRWIRESSF